MRRGKALSLARAIKVESTKCNYVKPHLVCLTAPNSLQAFRVVAMCSLYTAGESLPGYGPLCRLYMYSGKEKIYAAKVL